MQEKKLNFSLFLKKNALSQVIKHKKMRKYSVLQQK